MGRLFALFALFALSTAAARAGLSDDLAPLVAHERYTLANGLQVIIRQDPRQGFVAVSVHYRAGSRDDPPGRSGLAHLFEHLMFQGSHDSGGGMLEWAGRLSAIEMNATTWRESTRFHETVPAGSLETALWLESDRMGWLTLAENTLAMEKAAVKNERRQNVLSVPYGLAEEAFFGALFPPGHPYASSGGKEAQIDAATLGDAEAFYRSAYRPANATLAIVGDVDPKWVKARVARYFGPLPPGPPLRRAQVAPVRLDREVRVHHPERLGPLPRVYLGWLSPAFFSPGDAAGDLLAAILAGGRSSRLARRLDRAGLARNVVARQQSFEEQSVFRIVVTTGKADNPEDVIAAIDQELAELRARGPTADELAAALASWEVTLVSRLDGVRGLGRTAEELQSYNHVLGQPAGLLRDLERYRAVTPEEVRRFAAEVLEPARRVVLIAEPVQAGGQP